MGQTQHSDCVSHILSFSQRICSIGKGMSLRWWRKSFCRCRCTDPIFKHTRFIYANCTHTLTHSIFLIFLCREMRLVSDAYSNECFEPLIISSVPITTLTSWGRKDEFSKLQPTDYSCLEIPRHRASPFPCSDNINNRFIIW